MIRMTTQLRNLLSSCKVVVAPGGYDPLSMRIIENLGFKAAYLGGWATGAHLCTTEPLTTMTEQVGHASNCAKAIKIPLIVDAGAGYGEPVHTIRAVREFERAGVAAIHIEDQIFPKRAHYHKGVIHLIPPEEMVQKIKAAVAARGDKDFVVMARTDAAGSVGGSLDEAIRRAHAYVEAGADVILPHKMKGPQDAERFSKAVTGIPLMWIDVFSGLSVKDISDLGYRMIIYPLVGIAAAAGAVMSVYGELKKIGAIKTNLHELATIRDQVGELIGLPEYYKIEEKTTEKA